MPAPVAPDSGHIKIVPGWAAELFKSHGSEQTERPAAEDRTALFDAAFVPQEGGVVEQPSS